MFIHYDKPRKLSSSAMSSLTETILSKVLVSNPPDSLLSASPVSLDVRSVPDDARSLEWENYVSGMTKCDASSASPTPCPL